MFEAVRENELEKANELFQSSLRKSAETKNIEELSEFAAELHRLGFLDEARDAFLLLKQLEPQTKQWELALAEVAIDQNRQEEALDLLLYFESSDPLYPQALVVMADAYQTMGLYEISEQKLLEAVGLLPDEPVLLLALAKLYHSNGDYQKATTLYEQLRNSDNQKEWMENFDILLADCYNAEGKFEDAVFLLNNVPEEAHTSDSLFQLGLAYLQIHEPERAARVLTNLIEKDPDYVSAYLHLAQAYEETEKLEEALQAILMGIEIDPFQPEFRLAAAKLFLRRGEKQEARTALTELLALDPDRSEGAILLSEMLLEEGETEEVVSLLSGQVHDDASEPIYHWQLAQAYNELEDFEVAGQEYENAATALYDNLDFLRDYSRFLLEEGNLMRLKEITEHALILDPNNDYFLELLEDRLDGSQ